MVTRIGRYKMAKIERGSFTPGGTGNTTVLFSDSTLTADEIELFMGPAGSSDSDNHICLGYMTPTQQSALSTYSDTTGEKTEQVNNKCMKHYARVSGSISVVMEATRQSMATAGEFTINISTWTTGYTIYFRAKEY